MTEPVKAGRLSNFFTIIRQSLNGEEQDYTQGSIRRAVFCWPFP